MSRFKKIKGIWIIDDDELEGMEETEVVFNKEGWYFDRLKQKSWYEVETSVGIRAFKSDKEYFYHCWKQECHVPLSDKEVDAARTLLYNFNIKELRELYLTDLHWKDIRNIYRRVGD